MMVGGLLLQFYLLAHCLSLALVCGALVDRFAAIDRCFRCVCFSTEQVRHNCGISVRGAKPGKNVQLTENEIKGLCLKSREIFLSQPILLELEAPLKICGKSLFYSWRRRSSS